MKRLLFLFPIFIVGCAHQLMRGTVAMRISDEEAHICLGEGEVKPGDKVAIWKNNCNRTTTGKASFCRLERVGEGEVTKILNEHYSVMRVPAGTTFDEGTFVQKE